MKKILLKIFSCGCFIAILLIYGLISEFETHYTRLVTCTKYSYEDNLYTFKDNDGKIWLYETNQTEHYTVGNVYRLTMSDNHTDIIFDDIILKIKTY